PSIPLRSRANLLPSKHAEPNRTHDRRRQSRHTATTTPPTAPTPSHPSLPRVARQACAEPGRSADWLDHRARVFADLAPVGHRAENIHAVCIKISPKLPNEFNVSSKCLASSPNRAAPVLAP